MKDIKLALASILLLTNWCHATEDAKSHLVTVRRYALRMSFFLVKIDKTYASGICIDKTCSVVVTPYHSQIGVGRATLGVVGGRTTRKVLSLANESDANTTDVPTTKGIQHFDVAEDISFVYTGKPAHHKTGISYSFRPQVGQIVLVAGYVKSKFEMREAHIIGINVPVFMGQGTLDQTLILDIQTKPGMSGHAVLDLQGNLLGMITMSGNVRQNDGDLPVSVALPLHTIATALKTLDPSLAASVFGDIPADDNVFPAEKPLSYEEPIADALETAIPTLTPIPVDVPDALDTLQAKAGIASELMTNYVAKQCLMQAHRSPVCYELSFRDGEQSFQEIKKGGKLGKPINSFPVQPSGMWITTNWADDLRHVADSPWIFKGKVNDGYLFAFAATAEDERCAYTEYWAGLGSLRDILFGTEERPSWQGSVPCSEQVLTDRDFNVVSIFVERRPPDPCRAMVVQTLMTFGRVKLTDIETPILVPTTATVMAQWSSYQRTFYTKVVWSDYRKFRADHRFVSDVQ